MLRLPASDLGESSASRHHAYDIACDTILSEEPDNLGILVAGRRNAVSNALCESAAGRAAGADTHRNDASASQVHDLNLVAGRAVQFTERGYDADCADAISSVLTFLIRVAVFNNAAHRNGLTGFNGPSYDYRELQIAICSYSHGILHLSARP